LWTVELLITTESDDVKVVIRQGGKLVDVIDTKTDKQIRLALRSGEYELELRGAPERLKLTIDKATLTRGKETLTKIERIDKAAAQVGEVRQFLGHKSCVTGVVFFKDGRRFVCCGESDRTIRVWDVATGKELARFDGHTGPNVCCPLGRARSHRPAHSTGDSGHGHRPSGGPCRTPVTIDP
jgi:WD40 repeat protein